MILELFKIISGIHYILSISNVYINEDNIETIKFSLYETSEEYNVYKLDNDYWTYNNGVFYKNHKNTNYDEKFHKVTEYSILEAQSDLREYGNNSINDYYNNKIKELKEDKNLQELIMQGDLVAQYEELSGYINVYISMVSGKSMENKVKLISEKKQLILRIFLLKKLKIYYILKKRRLYKPKRRIYGISNLYR